MLRANIYRLRRTRERSEVNIELLDSDTGDPIEVGAAVVADWTTLTPNANAWAAFDGSVAQYRKRPDGVVEFRGFVDPGSDGSNILSTPLATEYRHNHAGTELFFPCVASGGEIVCMVLKANGQMQGAYVNGPSNMTDLAWVDLSSIRYSVD
jgi:hypothetical protein